MDLSKKMARTLDQEFVRVAKLEDRPLAELVGQVAQDTGYSTRQLYNFREGRTELPASLLPYLCARFGSGALVDLLLAECTPQVIEVPELFDLARLTSGAVKDTLKHYERYLDAFESNGVDAGELEELEQSGERVIQTVRQFHAIATADHQKRASARSGAGR